MEFCIDRCLFSRWLHLRQHELAESEWTLERWTGLLTLQMMSLRHTDMSRHRATQCPCCYTLLYTAISQPKTCGLGLVIEAFLLPISLRPKQSLILQVRPLTSSSSADIWKTAQKSLFIMKTTSPRSHGWPVFLLCIQTWAACVH